MAEMPPGVVTVTSVVPTAPDGDVTVMEVPAPLTTTPVPGLAPKSTAVAPARFVPVTVTELPPVVVPVRGANPVTVGKPKYVKESAALVALVPSGVTTVTSTVPADSAGEVTVREVPPPLTTTPVPGVTPKSTAVAPVKLVPVTVTVVPPAMGPPVGLPLVTLGGGWTPMRTATDELMCDPPWLDSGCTTPGPTGL